ncbi:hypothetical protein [Fibrobacter intestinalis]|uniref:hypothetical protein n=1 Tax=Fibrobacter sp. NR9 TaxID=1896200 RepID=UPI0013044D83|nr:hypothetical protein [Fibrobacter sp. NR9]
MAQKVSKRNDELIRFEISLGADFSFFSLLAKTIAQKQNGWKSFLLCTNRNSRLGIREK